MKSWRKKVLDLHSILGFEVKELGTISFFSYLEVYLIYAVIEAKGSMFMKDFMVLLSFIEISSFDASYM